MDGKVLGTTLLLSIKGYVARSLDPYRRQIDVLGKRIRELEARIAELEARPQALGYGGTWSAGQESKAGFFYTDRGQVWYARETTRDRPGETAAFQLAVRRGQDAR